jgi:hypothetical protein
MHQDTPDKYHAPVVAVPIHAWFRFAELGVWDALQCAHGLAVLTAEPEGAWAANPFVPLKRRTTVTCLRQKWGRGERGEKGGRRGCMHVLLQIPPSLKAQGQLVLDDRTARRVFLAKLVHMPYMKGPRGHGSKDPHV